MSERWRPNQRIRSRRVFQIIFKRGKWAKGFLLNLWSYGGPEVFEEDGPPQLAVMVSRKVNARATQRNLWKRRIREVFRRHQAEIKNGTAVLIQARKQNKTPSYAMIESEVMTLLAKTGSGR